MGRRRRTYIVVSRDCGVILIFDLKIVTLQSSTDSVFGLSDILNSTIFASNEIISAQSRVVVLLWQNLLFMFLQRTAIWYSYI